jgi:toxin ParE1/3/4
MARVVWRRRALDELDGILAYITQFDPAAAERKGAALFSLGESLSSSPDCGRPLEDGTREMVIVSPYILHYKVRGDRVAILSIRHSARADGD